MKSRHQAKNYQWQRGEKGDAGTGKQITVEKNEKNEDLYFQMVLGEKVGENLIKIWKSMISLERGVRIGLEHWGESVGMWENMGEG